MPKKNRTAERNANGADWTSKDRECGIPIASPIMNTSVWSAIWFGEVRKNHARVTWKREREVIIVAADISAIFASFGR